MMDKAQAIDKFWNSFGIPAFDQYTIPDDKRNVFPRITYSVYMDNFDRPVVMNASLWYKSKSWKEITQKTDEISKAIEEAYPITKAIDDGRLYITKGTPWAQRMDDPEDDNIRRMYLTIQVEYLTRW